MLVALHVYALKIWMWIVCLMVYSATFNNISVISWRSVLLVEETGGPGENHRPDKLYLMLHTSLWSRLELPTCGKFVSAFTWQRNISQSPYLTVMKYSSTYLYSYFKNRPIKTLFIEYSLLIDHFVDTSPPTRYFYYFYATQRIRRHLKLISSKFSFTVQ